MSLDSIIRSERHWQWLSIELRFQKMYGFSTVMSLDSIIQKNAQTCPNIMMDPPGPLNLLLSFFFGKSVCRWDYILSTMVHLTLDKRPNLKLTNFGDHVSLSCWSVSILKWFLWNDMKSNISRFWVNHEAKADNGFPGKSAHPLHYYHINSTSPIDCWYGP